MPLWLASSPSISKECREEKSSVMQHPCWDSSQASFKLKRLLGPYRYLWSALVAVNAWKLQLSGLKTGQFVLCAPLCPRCRYVNMSGSVKPPLYWDQLLFCCKQSGAHKGTQILPLLFRQSCRCVRVHRVCPGCRVFFKKTEVLIGTNWNTFSFLDDRVHHAVSSADGFHVCSSYGSVATQIHPVNHSF